MGEQHTHVTFGVMPSKHLLLLCLGAVLCLGTSLNPNLAVNLLQFVGNHLEWSDAGTVDGTAIWAAPIASTNVDKLEIWIGVGEGTQIALKEKLEVLPPTATRYQLSSKKLRADATHFCVVSETANRDDSGFACVELRPPTITIAEPTTTSTVSDTTTDAPVAKANAAVTPGARITTLNIQKAGDYRDHTQQATNGGNMLRSLIKVLAGNCSDEKPLRHFPHMECDRILTDANLCDELIGGTTDTYKDVCPCTCGVCREAEAVVCTDKWIDYHCPKDGDRVPKMIDSEKCSRYYGCAIVARDGGRCIKPRCWPGTYLDETGDAPNCLSCPDHSTSADASIGIDSCKCLPGYYHDNNQCHKCQAGTYSKVAGSNTCLGCPPFTTSPEVSSDISQCVCIAGYQPSETGCRPCDTGYYKPSVGAYACHACRENTTSPPAAIESTQCVCLDGFVSLPDSSCLACPSGTYFDKGHCLHCPIFSQSSPASVGIRSCLCGPGHQPASNEHTDLYCSACPYGTYKPSNLNEPCTPCPKDSYSHVTGATTPVYCTVLPRFVTPRQYYLPPGYYPPEFYPSHYYAYPSHRALPAMNAMGMMGMM